MIEKYIYLSVFYCLCYEIDISTDMSEEQMLEQIDPDLNEEEDIIIDNSREENWRYVAEEDDNNKNIHYLRQEVYVKVKEELINR